MKFRTTFQPTPSEVRLSVHRPVLFFGSCFADYICHRMIDSDWNAYNPGGRLFNPISISYAIQILLLEEDEKVLNRMIRDSLIEHDGVWHSLLFDTECSSTDKKSVVSKIMWKRQLARELMAKNADVILTFGTAWTYALVANVAGMEGKVVGNCHKLPARLFERRLLTIEEITEEWSDIINRLKEKWPKTNLIFTLSPVRHLKDGFAGNSLSKGLLRVAIHELINRQRFAGNQQIDYFSAYEILNDDLRDYRFYDSDLVHPCEMAVDYIWENMKLTFLNKADLDLLKEADRIIKAFNHRSLVHDKDKDLPRLKKLELEYFDLGEKWPERRGILPMIEDLDLPF